MLRSSSVIAAAAARAATSSTVHASRRQRFIAAATTLIGERPQAKPNGNGKDHAAANRKRSPRQNCRYEDEAGNLLFGVVRVEYQNPDGSFVTKDGKRKKDISPASARSRAAGQMDLERRRVPIVPYGCRS